MLFVSINYKKAYYFALMKNYLQNTILFSKIGNGDNDVVQHSLKCMGIYSLEHLTSTLIQLSLRNRKKMT